MYVRKVCEEVVAVKMVDGSSGDRKKLVIVRSKIGRNILFNLQQTLMGESNQEWGGSGNYCKCGNDKKCLKNF